VNPDLKHSPKTALVVLAGLLLAACAAPPALQTVYRAGVPHTDARGRPLMAFDGARSFFPLGIYHALSGEHFGQVYSFAPLKAAGFNTVHAWERQPLEKVLEAAGRNGLQVIHHYPTDADVTRHKGNRRLLAWYLDEEPTLKDPISENPARLMKFRERRAEIRALDPVHPVLAIDGHPREERTGEWLAWAGAGDISAHFNYPVIHADTKTLDSAHSIPRSIAMAARAVGEKKPVWFVVQAFKGPRHGWRMPSHKQLRAMTYAAVIHGATGIIYFGLDSFVMRDGDVIGLSPDPKTEYGPAPDFDQSKTKPLVADKRDLARAKALWREARRLNRELASLKPFLLSPTSNRTVSISVSGDAISPAPIRAILKERNGELLLLAVNLDNVPLDAAFVFDARPAGVTTPLGGPPPHASGPGSRDWRVPFAGFQVRVYKFRLQDLAKRQFN